MSALDEFEEACFALGERGINEVGADHMPKEMIERYERARDALFAPPAESTGAFGYAWRPIGRTDWEAWTFIKIRPDWLQGGGFEIVELSETPSPREAAAIMAEAAAIEERDIWQRRAERAENALPSEAERKAHNNYVEALRRKAQAVSDRMVQALHAGISRRDWHATEVAANAIRDSRDAQPDGAPDQTYDEETGKWLK